LSLTHLGTRYNLVALLGEGGMAQVYRAHDNLLDRPVAIKILRDQYAKDPAFLARFRHEAKAEAGLSHPNIVNVYDVGQENGQQFIVMEYVEGESLKELIRREAPLALGFSLEIAAQICDAVQSAHDKGIIHRDVKPQNVIIAPGGKAKVADFGLAKGLAWSSVSEAGVVLGTAHYLSPEQAQGQAATEASDIYAIGVLLYEMLTGRLPFQGDTAVAVALQHVQDEPVPPRRLNARIPQQVQDIILRAMAKDPTGRFASAREMADALRAYVRFGEETTSAFQPVQPAKPKNHITPRVIPREPDLLAEEPMAAGVDWLLLFLILTTIVCVLGLVPLGIQVYGALVKPTPTPLPNVTVPDLVGLDLAQAEARLGALGLQLQSVGERYDDKIPAGRVLAQFIVSGSTVKTGEVVQVLISKGQELIAVPSLVDRNVDHATDILERLGLKADRRDEPNEKVPEGIVFEQFPPANTTVPRNSSVRLSVSSGNRVVVPDLFGKSEAEAQSAILGLGLATAPVNRQGAGDVPENQRWVFGQVPIGHVISQTPGAGTWVKRGTTIYLAVRRE